MQKSIVQNNLLVMKKLVAVIYLCVAGGFCCEAQSDEFQNLVNQYYTKLALPIASVNTLAAQDTVDRSLLNKVLFDQQSGRAKFYSTNDSLYRATTYGKIDEGVFDYETWSKEDGKVKWHQQTFVPKAYAIGNIPLAAPYHALITKVVGAENTYIDLYLFNQQGTLLSLVNLYEAEYEKLGNTDDIAQVFMQSSISQDGVIQRHEDRFSVVTDRKYRLQPDGYFKVIDQRIEGEYEP